jgi:hypothetical protein
MMGLPPTCDLCKSHLICHSEGAERPKNLIITGKHEILCSAQDDKMVFRRGLNFELEASAKVSIAILPNQNVA